MLSFNVPNYLNNTVKDVCNGFYVVNLVSGETLYTLLLLGNNFIIHY